jgi:YggT family protein
MPSSLIQLLDALLGAYSLILLGTALISWFPVNPRNPIVQFMHRITEPVLTPIRQSVPSLGGIDFSIVIVLIIISLLRNALWTF